jgi:hypothetical protein
MILNRGIDVEKLELVCRPKPCTALLQVGDYVRLSLGGSAVRVLDISGDDVIIENCDWQGKPEAMALPRICLRKARLRSWLCRVLHRFTIPA